MKMSKTYILNIKGVCVEEDEIENTTIHICRNGEWCEIPWNKDDIVSIEENENEWSIQRYNKSFIWCDWY